MKPYFIKEKSLLNKEPELRDIFIQCRLFNLEISREEGLADFLFNIYLHYISSSSIKIHERSDNVFWDAVESALKEDHPNENGFNALFNEGFRLFVHQYTPLLAYIIYSDDSDKHTLINIKNDLNKFLHTEASDELKLLSKINYKEHKLLLAEATAIIEDERGTCQFTSEVFQSKEGYQCRFTQDRTMYGGFKRTCESKRDLSSAEIILFFTEKQLRDQIFEQLSIVDHRLKLVD
tara:strand:- start:406 stop:1110 length:705 start_codon:yes stop_codon:yes gene_type:complete